MSTVDAGAALGMDAAWPQPTFAGLGLDRAALQREDAAWLSAQLQASDTRFVVINVQDKALADGEGAPRWLTAAEYAKCQSEVPVSLLGIGEGKTWFALRVGDGDTGLMDAVLGGPPPAWVGLREAGMRWPVFASGLFAYARALLHWQDQVRFCGTCGAPCTLQGAGHRALCTRVSCGQVRFPRTDPAMIVIVEHDGRCLLGRKPEWPRGRWSTLAGFSEPGEAIEDCVRREVFEETGVQVDQCHYLASQPWPFPASLMFGFIATAQAEAIALGDGELEEARWFAPGDIVEGMHAGTFLPSASMSISWQLLAYWLRLRAGLDLAAL